MAKTLSHRVLLAAAAGIALAACSPTLNTRGNLAEMERVELIQPGVTTADDVVGILGSPSTVGTFAPNVWYYIGQRTEKTAFFRPDVVERRVLIVEFDENRVVRDMRRLDASAGQEIELVERQTPTSGKELGILEQILGNLGRFNNAGQDGR